MNKPAPFRQADVERVIRAAKRQKQGHVYFVWDGGPVKIGFSTDIPKRIAALQTGCAHPIDLIHSVLGSVEDEAAFHARFAHLRLSGEWFAFKGELLEFLSPFMEVVDL
jgi:hypothetical protein